MSNKVSPAYAAEYRSWIADGSFARLREVVLPHLAEALAQQHPALMGMNLDQLSTCYYLRGAVALLDGEMGGWGDIQRGFVTAAYGLRFKIKSLVLPAWSSGRVLAPREKISLVWTLGLAILFGLDVEVKWLTDAVQEWVDLDEVVGKKVRAGRKLLESILVAEAPHTITELQEDRRQSCQRRDAWPPRPTDVVPFGVLDVEAILRFPQDASFQFPSAATFERTDDDAIDEAIVAYHVWYE